MMEEGKYSENIDSLDIPLNGTGIQVQVPIVIPFLPFGLLIILITILGLIGNSLCALVISRTRLRSSYSVLTLGLTFCDSVYLITKLIRYGLDSLFTYFEIAKSYTNVFLPIVGPYLRPITFTAHTGSTYFTMALAVDRYIAVCWTPKHRFLCTRIRARCYNTMILLFAILYNITRWFEFHTETVEMYNLNGDLETYHTMKISPLRENPDYRLYFIFWAYLVIMFLIPFSTLTTLNLILWCAISKINRKMSHPSSVQSRDNSFTLMLIGVVVVFLLCNLDYLILDLLEFFSQPFSEFWNHVGNVLLTVNSAVNFIIYCLCGKNFRRELAGVFREWFGKSEQTQNESVDNSEDNEFGFVSNTNTMEARL